jgi:ankyrin repeat protein
MIEGRANDFENLANDLTRETLNSVDSQGYTLLEWGTAFSTSDWPIDQFLKDKGAEMLSDEGSFRRNVFFIGLQYLPPDKKLLSFDRIDINGVNKTGDTALHLALYGEEWELAEEILNRFENYDVNLTSSLDDTPLLLAARLDCEFGLLKKILNRTNSENVNKTDRFGYTALYYAIHSKSETKLQELLKREDVDVNITYRYNDGNALNLVSKHWKDIPSDFLNLILEKTTDVNSHSQGKKGHTALHYAIIHESETATKALLAHKDVDVNIKNNNHETALSYASKWKDIPMDLYKNAQYLKINKNKPTYYTSANASKCIRKELTPNFVD